MRRATQRILGQLCSLDEHAWRQLRLPGRFGGCSCVVPQLKHAAAAFWATWVDAWGKAKLVCPTLLDAADECEGGVAQEAASILAEHGVLVADSQVRLSREAALQYTCSP